MKWSSAVVGALVAALGSGGVRAQAPAAERDLGAEARGVFARKCAGCHGPDLPKPQGRFGYVLDLRRVAGNPEMVVPGRPDESELWVLVSHDDMPPADSPRGPLTAAEKESVRAWDAAGAPDAPAAPDARQSADVPPSPNPELATLSSRDRVVRFLGKFHLLLLHFPLALMIAAGVADFAAWRRGSREASPVVGFCLTFAAVVVVPTVVLGWLSTRNPGRPRMPEDLRKLVLRIANDNGWGYSRILGELRKLVVRNVSRTTVINILKEAGLDPSPKRGKGTWDEFVKRHASTLWACDFLSVRSLTITGFVDL
jgi:mono/diheme cytochrome c family protein